MGIKYDQAQKRICIEVDRPTPSQTQETKRCTGTITGEITLDCECCGGGGGCCCDQVSDVVTLGPQTEADRNQLIQNFLDQVAADPTLSVQAYDLIDDGAGWTWIVTLNVCPGESPQAQAK